MFNLNPFYDVQHLLAGSWTLVWHWGVGIGLVILCGVGAWFSPVFKKDFLYAAIIILVALLFEGIGIHDEAARCVAQQQVVIKYVEKAVTKAKTPAAKKARDPWNNRSN